MTTKNGVAVTALALALALVGCGKESVSGARNAASSPPDHRALESTEPSSANRATRCWVTQVWSTPDGNGNPASFLGYVTKPNGSQISNETLVATAGYKTGVEFFITVENPPASYLIWSLMLSTTGSGGAPKYYPWPAKGHFTTTNTSLGLSFATGLGWPDAEVVYLPNDIYGFDFQIGLFNPIKCRVGAYNALRVKK
jgi:hypothetical protein